MAEDIPTWAKERVIALCEASDENPSTAFARYIAEHEEPPVDPVKAAADEIVAEEFPNARPENKWALDKVAYLGVKRGLELAARAKEPR